MDLAAPPPPSARAHRAGGQEGPALPVARLRRGNRKRPGRSPGQGQLPSAPENGPGGDGDLEGPLAPGSGGGTSRLAPWAPVGAMGRCDFPLGPQRPSPLRPGPCAASWAGRQARENSLPHGASSQMMIPGSPKEPPGHGLPPAAIGARRVSPDQVSPSLTVGSADTSGPQANAHPIKRRHGSIVTQPGETGSPGFSPPLVFLPMPPPWGPCCRVERPALETIRSSRGQLSNHRATRRCGGRG